MCVEVSSISSRLDKVLEWKNAWWVKEWVGDGLVEYG